jgi:hypothetical protein
MGESRHTGKRFDEEALRTTIVNRRAEELAPTALTAPRAAPDAPSTKPKAKRK